MVGGAIFRRSITRRKRSCALARMPARGSAEELAWAAVEHGNHARPLLLRDTIQAVLAARLDRLPPEAKHLAQIAAVLGPEVPVPLLHRLAGLPEEVLQRGLAHLQAAEFLVETQLFPEPVSTFKHALTQDVVYGSLLQERRRVLHAQILDALETLAAHAMARGEPTAGVRHLRRLLAVDPLRESARACLIRAHLAEGNQCEALREFKRFSHILKAELGLTPTPQLRRLVETLL